MALYKKHRESTSTEPISLNILQTKQGPSKITKIITWQCYVCYQQKKSHFFRFAQCNHKFVCNGCCQQQLKACLQNMKKPTCFVQKCNAGLYTGDDSAFQHFSSTVKQQWEQKKLVLNLHREGNILVRRCPKPDCTGFLLKKDRKSMISIEQTQKFLNFYECHVCSIKYCQDCFKPFHGNQNCIRQTIELPQQLKQCPNCEVVIDKYTGCNKVECKACTYVFCFNCRAQWSQQHKNCQGTVVQQIKNFFWGLSQRIFKCENDNAMN